MNKPRSLKTLGSTHSQKYQKGEKNSRSIVKKQKYIAEQLKLFPIYGTRSQSSFVGAENRQFSGDLTPQIPKKKPALKRGKSLDVQKKKLLGSSSKFLKKTIEHGLNNKKDSSPLRRRGKNKVFKEESISRVSLGISEPTFSLPSSQHFCPQTDLLHLQEQNKMFKKTIERQLQHIRSLQLIIKEL